MLVRPNRIESAFQDVFADAFYGRNVLRREKDLPIPAAENLVAAVARHALRAPVEHYDVVVRK